MCFKERTKTEADSNENISGYHWKLILTLMSVWLLSSTSQMFLPMLTPSIMEEWGLGYTTIGSIRSIARIGGTIGGLFLGVLTDYTGRRRCLMLIMPLSSVFISLVGLSKDWVQLAFTLAAFAFVSSGIFPALFTFASEELPPKRRGFGISVIASGYALGGGILASVLVTTLSKISWRAPFFVVSAPMVVVFLALKSLSESKVWLTLNDEGKRVERGSWKKKILDLKLLKVLRREGLSNLSSLTGVLLVRVLASMLWTGVTLWVTAFLVVERGLPQSTGAIWFTIFGITGLFGNWFNGWCADKLGRRKTISLFYSIVGLLIFLFAVYTHTVLHAYLMSVPIGFMLLGLYPTTFTFTSEALPSEARASGMALTMIILQPLTISLPSIIGVVSTVYSIALCFKIIALITIVIGTALFFFIPETKAKIF